MAASSEPCKNNSVQSKEAHGWFNVPQDLETVFMFTTLSHLASFQVAPSSSPSKKIEKNNEAKKSESCKTCVFFCTSLFRCLGQLNMALRSFDPGLEQVVRSLGVSSQLLPVHFVLALHCMHSAMFPVRII